MEVYKLSDCWGVEQGNRESPFCIRYDVGMDTVSSLTGLSLNPDTQPNTMADEEVG
jgi:hypothetical protein